MKPKTPQARPRTGAVFSQAEGRPADDIGDGLIGSWLMPYNQSKRLICIRSELERQRVNDRLMAAARTNIQL